MTSIFLVLLVAECVGVLIIAFRFKYPQEQVLLRGTMIIILTGVTCLLLTILINYHLPLLSGVRPNIIEIKTPKTVSITVDAEKMFFFTKNRQTLINIEIINHDINQLLLLEVNSANAFFPMLEEGIKDEMMVNDSLFLILETENGIKKNIDVTLKHLHRDTPLIIRAIPLERGKAISINGVTFSN